MTVIEPPPVVVRVRQDRADRLQALLAAPGPHVERLVDVGRAPNGDLLLVVPAPAARPAELVLVPGWPSAGEAVTVLAPLATALAGLHGAGVAHGAVGLAAVALDTEGSPSWTGPDAPVLRRAVGDAAFAPAVAADVAAFRELCRALLGGSAPGGADLASLAAALFTVAEPRAVRLHPAPATVEPVAPPSRLLPALAPDPQRAEGVRSWAGRSEAVRSRVGRVVAPLRTVRRRVWVAAGTVALLLAVVPALLPADRPEPAATAVARTARTAVPVPTVAPTQRPEAALRALVAARARCLATGSERCLAGVDAAGSPVLQSDLAAVASGAEAIAVDGARLAIRSTSGGLVLADAAGSTVLAVREPDGWRLRDVVAKR
ncbi:hypothetical protein [uncultured Amnibacterium sp.]|uniref:hypothetical protein n=1 Tax=uncultured Amnibacterium sp. TaxID=1631851 RepID=UPI0035CC27DA